MNEHERAVAIAIGKYLEAEGDWNVFDVGRHCPDCHYIAQPDARYCYHCGTRLPRREPDDFILDIIYQAYQAGCREAMTQRVMGHPDNE